MAHDITPEERLLRLIRGKTKQADSAPQGEQAASKLFSTFNQKIISTIIGAAGLFEVFNLQRVRLILLALIFVFITYSLSQFFVAQPSLKLERIKISNAVDTEDSEERDIPGPKPYSYYSQKIESRDVFNAPFLASAAGGAAVAATADERIANLSLVGIVLDAKPQAIIEDKKENKTYFLNKGDQLGEFLVEDIQESKVVLSIGEDKFEMVP